MKLLNYDIIEEAENKTKGLKSRRRRCCFCCTDDNDLGKYGPLYTLREVTVHYFCLLLSDSKQNGKDKDGIFGYLPIDIKKELMEGKRRQAECAFCHSRSGVPIRCTYRNGAKRCNTRFHFPCGREEGCRTILRVSGNFSSLCKTHSPKTKITTTPQWKCIICREGDLGQLVKTPCCFKGTLQECVNPYFLSDTVSRNILHKSCVQKAAWISGSFFQCPLCGDKTERNFRESMIKNGVFIPKSDADHLVEDEDNKVEMVNLPKNVMSCVLDADENSISFYSTTMRNGTYSSCSGEIIISPETPVPNILVNGFPKSSSKNWIKTRGGGASFAPEGDRLIGFLRLLPMEPKIREQINPRFELALVVYDGAVNLEYSRADTRATSKVLSKGGVAVIPPSAFLALTNNSNNPVHIVYIYSEVTGAAASCSFVITPYSHLNWTPAEGLSDISLCWAQENEKRGFYSIEGETTYPFSMNTCGNLIFLVLRGQLKLRSTRFEVGKEPVAGSSKHTKRADEEEEDEKRPHLVPYNLQEGSIFLIPNKCCFALENWTMEETVLFYQISS